MKKLLTILLTLALVLSLSEPAFAAPNQTEAQTNLSFVYEAVVPTYTVSIPATLVLSNADQIADDVEGNRVFEKYMTLGISDTQNLGTQKVSISLTDCQHESGAWFLLQNTRLTTNYLFLAIDGGGNLNLYNRPLFESDVDATKSIPIRVSEYKNYVSGNRELIPGDTYTGYIVFGIKLV